jgi:hypothetical protein
MIDVGSYTMTTGLSREELYGMTGVWGVSNKTFSFHLFATSLCYYGKPFLFLMPAIFSVAYPRQQISRCT